MNHYTTLALLDELEKIAFGNPVTAIREGIQGMRSAGVARGVAKMEASAIPKVTSLERGVAKMEAQGAKMPTAPVAAPRGRITPPRRPRPTDDIFTTSAVPQHPNLAAPRRPVASAQMPASVAAAPAAPAAPAVAVNGAGTAGWAAGEKLREWAVPAAVGAGAMGLGAMGLHAMGRQQPQRQW